MTPGQDIPWEARAVKSYSMADLEARKLKYPTTATESLLLGILTEGDSELNKSGTSEAARFLRKNGVTLFGVKDEIMKLLGKADMYFFSPEHPPLTTSAEKALNSAIDTKNRPEAEVYEVLRIAIQGHELDEKNSKTIVQWVVCAELHYDAGPVMDEWCNEIAQALYLNYGLGKFSCGKV